MPELPEVETTVCGIRKTLTGQKITALTFRHKQLRWPIPTSDIKKNLLNEKILAVTRRAKYILMQLPKGYFIIHLGMSGTLRVLDNNTPAVKHDHFDLTLKTGKILRFNDPRRFGALLWATSLADHALFQHLGLEPFDPQFDAKYLFAKAQNIRSPVKTFIMNQQIVVGVGNIYASESLYDAGVHPLRAANKITLAEWKKLVQKIKRVLEAAIAKGGTTLKDFAQSDGKPGYFSQKLKVYGKKEEPCQKCKTPISQVKSNGRSTYFCSNCQPFEVIIAN